MVRSVFAMYVASVEEEDEEDGTWEGVYVMSRVGEYG